MERVDALATTPVPRDLRHRHATAIVHISQIAAQMQPANYGAAAFTSTDPGLSPVGDAGPAGRVVILSTTSPARSSRLSKPAMVIGRTEGDNDICVNHRSISRHHAKIVREGRPLRHRRPAVVQRRAGQRRGYGRSRLRRGDVVDLGRVACASSGRRRLRVRPRRRGHGHRPPKKGGAALRPARHRRSASSWSSPWSPAARRRRRRRQDRGRRARRRPAEEPGPGGPDRPPSRNGGVTSRRLLPAATARLTRPWPPPRGQPSTPGNWDEAKKLAGPPAPPRRRGQGRSDRQAGGQESTNKKRYEAFKKAVGKGDLRPPTSSSIRSTTTRSTRNRLAGLRPPGRGVHPPQGRRGREAGRQGQVRRPEAAGRRWPADHAVDR